MSNIIQAAGAIAIAVGTAMIYLPAGIIIGGVLAILIGIGLGRTNV